MIGSLAELASALCGEVSGTQVLAPGPEHSPSDRSMAVRPSINDPDGFIVYSHAGDDWRACREHVRERLRLSDWQSSRAEYWRSEPSGREADTVARDLASAARIIMEAVPIIGTRAERYLRDVRGIDTDALRDVLERTDALLWHPAVFFNQRGHKHHGKRLGAIIGIMTDPFTSKLTGAISRTYIDSDGNKVGKAKTLGRPMGIIRLSRDEDVHDCLFIAEGLENALTGMAIGLRPMWAAGSNIVMKRFPVLAGIEALTIIADHDPSGAGEDAAHALATRWLEAGRQVRIFRRSSSGDLNDAIKARA
jgi:putative DNA primase/helicase